MHSIAERGDDAGGPRRESGGLGRGCVESVLDYDAVETVNLDRMIGATRLDAAVGRPKVDVATRLMQSAATARRIQIRKHEVSITDPVGVSIALDYDVIFSCVDRPWPRAVLNEIDYSDLIPVIDGGIALDTFLDGGLGNIQRTPSNDRTVVRPILTDMSARSVL